MLAWAERPILCRRRRPGLAGDRDRDGNEPGAATSHLSLSPPIHPSSSSSLPARMPGAPPWDGGVWGELSGDRGDRDEFEEGWIDRQVGEWVGVNGWIDKWTSVWMCLCRDGWTDTQVRAHVDGQRDCWTDRRIQGWTDRCMDLCVHGWMDKGVDGWMNGWIVGEE